MYLILSVWNLSLKEKLYFMLQWSNPFFESLNFHFFLHQLFRNLDRHYLAGSLSWFKPADYLP